MPLIESMHSYCTHLLTRDVKPTQDPNNISNHRVYWQEVCRDYKTFRLPSRAHVMSKIINTILFSRVVRIYVE